MSQYKKFPLTLPACGTINSIDESVLDGDPLKDYIDEYTLFAHLSAVCKWWTSLTPEQRKQVDGITNDN